MNIIGPRRFKIAKRPWYWIFTFWKTKWTIPRYVAVEPGETDYDDAPLQETLIFNPEAFKMMVDDNPPKE